jgi:hypothetical protein
VVFTDHKPLVGALSRVSEPKSDWQRRQLSAIAEFTDIRHIAGQHNVVADTLSRPPVVAAAVGVRSYAEVLKGAPPFGGGSRHTRADQRVLFTFSLSTFSLSTFSLSAFTLSTFILFFFTLSTFTLSTVAAYG